jgi:hypothetical protein
MIDQTALYIATVQEAGHTFEAVGTTPPLARIRLYAGIIEFKRGESQTIRNMVDSAIVRPITSGDFKRT